MFDSGEIQHPLLPSLACLSGVLVAAAFPPTSRLPPSLPFSSAEPLARSSLLPSPLSWALGSQEACSWPADLWQAVWGISPTAGHSFLPGNSRSTERGQMETGLGSCWLILHCEEWRAHPECGAEQHILARAARGCQGQTPQANWKRDSRTVFIVLCMTFPLDISLGPSSRLLSHFLWCSLHSVQEIHPSARSVQDWMKELLPFPDTVWYIFSLFSCCPTSLPPGPYASRMLMDLMPNSLCHWGKLLSERSLAFCSPEQLTRAIQSRSISSIYGLPGNLLKDTGGCDAKGIADLCLKKAIEGMIYGVSASPVSEHKGRSASVLNQAHLNLRFSEKPSKLE